MMDTFNKFGVGVTGYPEQQVAVMVPVPRRMSKADALLLAAWLVALADERGQFEELLRAVRNT